MKYIFVDSDGVLNPNNKIADHRTVKVRTNNLPEYLRERKELYLDRKQGTWLKELASDTGAKLVWGTSWKQYANTYIGPKVGLPHMPYLPIRKERTDETYGEAKAKVVSRMAGSSRSVYFDDAPDLGVHVPANILHIYVDPRVGLTYSHIELARSFLLT